LVSPLSEPAKVEETLPKATGVDWKPEISSEVALPASVVERHAAARSDAAAAARAVNRAGAAVMLVLSG
jgi:hypothetical protein